MNSYCRQLNSKDALGYRQVRLQCLKDFPNHFGSNYEEQRALDKLFFEKQLEQNSSLNLAYGIFHQDANTEKLIAICCLTRGTQPRTNHRADINQVYVDKNYQGHGQGRILMQFVIDIAFDQLGLEQLSLGVVLPNPTANKLYEQLGFEEYGIQKHYFKIGEKYFDHRLMTKWNKKRVKG